MKKMKVSKIRFSLLQKASIFKAVLGFHKITPNFYKPSVGLKKDPGISCHRSQCTHALFVWEGVPRLCFRCSMVLHIYTPAPVFDVRGFAFEDGRRIDVCRLSGERQET